METWGKFCPSSSWVRIWATGAACFKHLSKLWTAAFSLSSFLDIINDRVKHFDQLWSAARTKGFEVSCVHEWVRKNVSPFGPWLRFFHYYYYYYYFKVYLAEIRHSDSDRNVSGRAHKNIMKVRNLLLYWESEQSLLSDRRCLFLQKDPALPPGHPHPTISSSDFLCSSWIRTVRSVWDHTCKKSALV